MFAAWVIRHGFEAAFGASLLLTLVLVRADPDAFAWLFGAVPPLLAVAVAGALAWPADRALGGTGSPVPWVRIVVIGAAFLLPPLVIDLAFRLPEAINVPVPEALAFYPVAGFVAQSLFHLVPLGVMAILLRRRDLPLWAYAPAIAGEPVFQMAFGGGLTLPDALVGLHVAIFGAAEIWAFRRYGFAAMYALRMSFYLAWHVAWGTLRLAFLFGA